ncbi:MAG: L-seryl-tRNA(Sec) selenium transferase [Chloroflexi bacterium]|nr:L-seryl-tRNA(Sec) selenium transferase [Chloroflexota bacterium]
MNNPYRQLPSIDRLISHAELVEATHYFGHTSVRNAARILLEDTRDTISSGKPAPDENMLVAALLQQLHDTLSPSLYPVINGSGVIVHTNLGRAPLSAAALDAMIAVASGYSNLEYNLSSGKRGGRYTHAERLLCELTGAEAALVVNNNAAAFTLLLRSVAAGKEVIVSRGELVEIGGGFRIPDILRQSGAELVEVGTTNRTRVSDYESALSEETAAFLKIHRSNFKIIGFTESTPLSALVELAGTHADSVAVLNDLGSGTLLDTRPFGLEYEPTVQDSVEAGTDATTFSGDKLLGGPQAGVIVGNKALIDDLKRQPLTRALRVDKTTLAALQATLLAYLRGTATQDIPVWQMISAPLDALARRVQQWAEHLTQAGVAVEVRPGSSAVGGGSLPGQTLPTTLLAVLSDQEEQLSKHLRMLETPVVARIEEDTLVFDPRTVLPDQDVALLRAIEMVWEQI